MKLVFSTHNHNKLKEIQALLPASIELLSLDDLFYSEEIPETADTLAENALLKARHIAQKFHVNCFADDTGLEVEALGGAPGVYSARYAGEDQDAEKNMQKLLAELQNKDKRKACFRTVIALILDGNEVTFEGRIEGAITQKKQGTKGFGYDPVFQPEGYKITFAQMETAEKNRISHRAQAVNKLVDFLRQKHC